MGSCFQKKQSKLRVVLFPHKQPVRLNVTLPKSCIVPGKDMWVVFGGKGSFFCKDSDDSLKLKDVVSPFLAQLIRFLETARIADGVFHSSSCAIKSSMLLASYTRPAFTSSSACWMPLLRGFLIDQPIFRERERRKRTSLLGTSK